MKKSNDQLAKEYAALKDKLKDLDGQLESLRSEIMERGPFDTENFLVTISDQSRESVVGAKELATCLGLTIPMLKAKQAIKLVVFKKLSVIQKQ